MYTTLANGIKVFYRGAGSPTGTTILLLHGFPASSNQYRNLIPLLAEKYHVIAPDLPGFGFTEVPSELDFKYTFDNLAATIESFLDVHGIQKYAVYVFDYGAPVGFRLAIGRPASIMAVITQNGNAYEDGLEPGFWAPLRKLWAAPVGSEDDTKYRQLLRQHVLTMDVVKHMYLFGEPNADSVDDPACYHLDYALMCRPGNKDIQIELFKDYGTNVALYPTFQEYFRRSQVPVLAVWGKNDDSFIPPGAEAFKRDLKDVRVTLLDAGHFAVEHHTKEIADLVLGFLAEKNL